MVFSLRNILLVWGIISFLSGFASSRQNTKICRKRYGKFPNAGTSCKGYYDCKNYVPTEMTCPNGEHFNANKQICDWAELYPCLDRQKDKECVRENGLFLKPETNCKEYFRCCNGKSKVESCPGDTLFDPSKENCEWPDLYTCVERQKDKECVRENGLFLKPGTNCKKYFRCCNGKSKVESCPGDTLFDPSKENCERPDLYTCVESLLTTEKVSSTTTTFATSTPPDDQKEETSTDVALKSTTQKTTSSNPSNTKFNTPSPPSEGQSTFQSGETSTFSQTMTKTVLTEIPTTLEPEEISIKSQSTTTEISSQPTTKTSTLQPTTKTTIHQMISSHSTDHTILKENKEFEITVFETTMEKAFSPSTAEVTTSAEVNIMCPEPTGHFPHPSDKHKFVACVNNIPYILDCPNDLVYKHRLRRCDYE